MSAKTIPGPVGDWIEVALPGGGPPHRGQIVEALGRAQHEHYDVHWIDDHESIHYPDDGTRIVPAHAPASGAAAVGEIALAAADCPAGVVLTAPGTCATGDGELGARSPAGSADLGVRAGDRVAILGATPPERTLTDLRGVVRGRRRGADLSHELGRGVRVHPRPRRRARGVCEDPDQLAKVARVCSRCPALGRAVLMTGDTPCAVGFGEL
jgi:hypothetical protein